MRPLGPSPSWRHHPPKRRTQSDGNSRHRSEDFSTLIVHEAAQFARRIPLRTLDCHPPGKAPASVIVVDVSVQRNSHPDPVRATGGQRSMARLVSDEYGAPSAEGYRESVRVSPDHELNVKRAQLDRSAASYLLFIHSVPETCRPLPRSSRSRDRWRAADTADAKAAKDPFHHSTPSALKTASTGSE